MSGSPDAISSSAPSAASIPTIETIGAARRLLADSSRCPACAAPLPGKRCPVCGVDLSHPDAGRIWSLSVRAVAVLDDREQLVRGLRERAQTVRAGASATFRTTPVAPASPPPAATRPVLPPVAGPPPSLPLPPLPPSPRAPLPRAEPAATNQGGGLGIHGVLVGVGALLLAVAAIGFLVFSWPALPLAGRAAVIAVATVGVLATASWLRGRLPETAEAVGALGVVLVLADCWAIRRTGLFHADHPDALLFAASCSAVCAVLLGGWALISRVRAGSLAAVALLPTAVLLAAAHWDGELAATPVIGLALVVVAVLMLARESLPRHWRAERRLSRSIAAGALLAAAAPAGFGSPGPARAGTVLLCAALAAGLQAVADAGAGNAADPRPRVALFLRRAWSLGAGLCFGFAALHAAITLGHQLALTDVTVLLPVTAVPMVAVLLSAVLPARPGAAVRRSAVAAGVVFAAALAAVPLLILVIWLPVRAGLIGAEAWSLGPGSQLADAGSQAAGDVRTWSVALGCLALIGTGTSLAARIGRWPGWLTRPLSVVPVVALAAACLVLPLLPPAPIAVAVLGLLIVSVALAAVVGSGVAAGFGRLAAAVTVAAWAASAASGTLAVVLAWSTRQLSVPLTLLGAGCLLLARRRLPHTAADAATAEAAAVRSRRTDAGTGSDIACAILAGLAASAVLIAVAGAAGLAGAGQPLRLAWAGVAGALMAAAFLGLPPLVRIPGPGASGPGSPARPGRAGWSAADRLSAALPGAVAVPVALIALADLNEQARWLRPGLFGVALVLVVVGACLLRPAISRVFPVLPLACAAAGTPVLGLLGASLRTAFASPVVDELGSAVLWAIVTVIGAVAATVAALTSRAEPGRRVATELGVALSGVIAIGIAAISGSGNPLWQVLLLLGAAAAMIASAPDRHRTGWLAFTLLTASSWTRLIDTDVRWVEAYSIPPALVLLTIAGYRLRRDRVCGPDGRPGDPASALAGGLTLGLGPSLVAATSGSVIRPALLLGLATIAVLTGAWVTGLRPRPPRSWSGGSAQPRVGPGVDGSAGPRRRGLGLVLAAAGALTATGTALLRSGGAVFTVVADLTRDRPSLALTSVELWTLPAAVLVLLVALLRAELLRVELLRVESRSPREPGPDTVVTEPSATRSPLARLLGCPLPPFFALLLAGVPTLIAAIVDTSQFRVAADHHGEAPTLAAVRIGLVLVLAALAVGCGLNRSGDQSGIVILAVAASVTGLWAGSGPVESWSGPLAGILLLQGRQRFGRLEAARKAGAEGSLAPSWSAYGAGLVVLLLPSLYLSLGPDSGTVLREIALIAVAGATLILGATRRMQAPLILGAGALVVQAIALLAPWFVEMNARMPVWGWVAAVGLALLLLGAGYERRMQQLRTVRSRLAALR